jgi:RNA polymerase sigma-70 factor (ECF subfamily)
MNEIPETYQTKDSAPDEVLEKMELNENIQQALLKIDEKYRALIILKHFQNCSYQQIAQIIDMPEKTVKSRLYIARQQLGKVLLQKGIS